MEILRLKDILTEKKMTGKELASLIDVTPASISNIVQGNSFPKPETLLKIAEALDMDIRDLFNSTKEFEEASIYIKIENEFIKIGKLDISKIRI